MIKKFSFTKCGSSRYFSGSLAVFASQSEATHKSLTFPYWLRHLDSNQEPTPYAYSIVSNGADYIIILTNRMRGVSPFKKFQKSTPFWDSR